MHDFFRNPERLFLAAYLLVMAFMAFYFNGTADDGDSVHHYLFARHAFEHPENFFNHWAKPLFVMLMAPAAQLGFVGVKLANIALMGLSIFLTCRLAERVGMRPPQLPMLFFFGAPIVVILTLSGLTEPMFACWLAVGVFWAFAGRLTGATVWLSFLPFVRSEGLVILCVWLVYLLVKKAWRLLPLLLTGHAVMGVLGWPIHRDVLWVFNKIPYQNLDGSSGYGRGTWEHFAVHFPDVFGPFITVFVAAGLVLALVRLLRFWAGKATFGKDELWLIYGIFVAYFVAHSMFWALGIFNSYGLMRVMLGVIPMVALIGGRAAEALLDLARQRKNFDKIVLALMIVGAAWGLNHKRVWRNDLMLNNDQLAYQKLAQKHRAALAGHTIYVDAIYPAVTLDIDLFDPQQRRHTPRLFTGEPVPGKSAVIWDYRYSVVDAHVPLEKIQQDPRFRQVDVFEDGGRALAYLFVATDSFEQNAHVLRSLDFEKNDQPGIDSTFGKDSRCSFRTDKANEYAPGMVGDVINFPAGSSIRMSCDVFVPELDGLDARVVVSYENAVGKVLDWQAFPVLTGDFEAGKWRKFIFDRAVDKEKFPDAKLKIYVWNPSVKPVFMDNLRFELK